MSGPATNPTPNPAPMRPKFWARRSGGLTSAMKALAVEYVAPAIPASTRPANSSHSVGAKPMIR